MEHLKYLKWINYAMAGLLAMAGLFGGAMGLIMLMASSSQSEAEGVFVSVLFMVLFMGITLPFALLHYLTGKRVAEGRWRIVQTILAIMGIMNMPVGTAYGLYSLWLCWMNEESKAQFV